MLLNNKEQMHNTLITQSCCLFWDQFVLTEKVSILVSKALSQWLWQGWEQMFNSGILPWKDGF